MSASPKAIALNGAGIRGGTAHVAGFKHALVSLVAACLAARTTLSLSNVPRIKETVVLAELLSRLGAAVTTTDDGMLDLDCTNITSSKVDEQLGKQIHGSIYLIPALMAAVREVQIAETGGCMIGSGLNGARPVQHMLDVLEGFGGRFANRAGWIVGDARAWSHAYIDVMRYSDSPALLTGPLVSGATKTALIAAFGVQAEGATVVDHPYTKPDVTEVIEHSDLLGVAVNISESCYRLSRARPKTTTNVPRVYLISDISEVMTYITLSVLARIPLEILGLTASRVRAGLASELDLLEKMGIPLAWGEDSVKVFPPDVVKSVDIEVTSVGIYSDHQPFFALMLLRAERPSFIRERVWRDRFAYLDELGKLGARYERNGSEVKLYPSVLRPCKDVLHGTDLRGAAALVIAAISTKGGAVVHGVDHLARGYSSLLPTLVRLGVDIRSA